MKEFVMDPITTALTVAWLDAVRRLQLAEKRRGHGDEQAAPVEDDQTLTAAIERALAVTAAAARNEVAPVDETAETGRLIDRLA